MDTKIIFDIISFYLEKGEAPNEEDIQLSDTIIEKPCFITIYKGGEIVGNSGNIKESNEISIWHILTSNVIEAIKEAEIKKEDIENIKIRVDFIEEKNKLTGSRKIKNINPTSMGTIAIKADYSDACVILPNISDKITSGDELVEALKIKIKGFKEEDFIIYELKTKQITNF